MTTHSPHNSTAILALLDGLLAGAHQPIDSLSAWAKLLASDAPEPVTVEFLTQLGAEWYRAPAPDALCTSTAAEVRERLAAHRVRGAHLWAHTLRVTGIALALAEESGDNPALVFLTAISHDVSKLDGDEGTISHEQRGAEFAGDVLRGDLPPATIAQIQAAIRKESGSTMGDILHDADKLDKIGAAGIVRRSVDHTATGDLRALLARVACDMASFPTMSFDASRTLAEHKREFLEWFIPQAVDALDTRG